MFARTLRGVLAATALVAAVSTAAEAQGRIGAQVGVGLPMGDFGDDAGLGLHVGGQYGLPLQGALGLRFNAEYGRYSGTGPADGSTLSLLGGMANVTYNIETGTGLMPYLLGGVGMFNAKVSNGALSFDESNLAFNFGVGYNFEASGRNFFAEIRYLSITEGDLFTALNTIPITFGFRF